MSVTYVVNRRRIRIEWGDCDPVGIVLASRVFEYFDVGSWSLFEAVLGVAPRDLARTFDIMGIPLVDARARMVMPLRFGDSVEILSSVAAFRRSSFEVEHRLLVDAEIAIEGRETRVWAAADKDEPSRLTARAIPPNVIERFKAG